MFMQSMQNAYRRAQAQEAQHAQHVQKRGVLPTLWFVRIFNFNAVEKAMFRSNTWPMSDQVSQVSHVLDFFG